MGGLSFCSSREPNIFLPGLKGRTTGQWAQVAQWLTEDLCSSARGRARRALRVLRSHGPKL